MSSETSARVAAPPRVLARAWAAFQDLQRGVRLVAFCLTGMLTMVGVASAAPTIGARVFAGLVAATLAFHVYAFLLNDLIDLPSDRLNPNRAHYPLVKGSFPPGLAWAICLAQPPLALALAAWAGARPAGLAALGAALVLITLYDLWGKRNPLPLLTDVAQGLGWGALAVLGAATGGAGPTPVTWWVVATITAAVTVMNGTHGSLRDLESDRASGRFTTAMLLGARGAAGGRLHIPRALRLYMLALMLAVAGLFAYAMGANIFGLGPLAWWAVASLLAALQGVALRTTYLLVRESRGQVIELLGYAYWHATLACFPLPFLFTAAWPLRLALLAVFLGPLLIYEWTYVFLGRWARRLSGRAMSLPTTNG